MSVISKLTTLGAAGSGDNALVTDAIDPNGSFYVEKTGPLLGSDSPYLTLSMWFYVPASLPNIYYHTDLRMTTPYGDYSGFYGAINSSETWSLEVYSGGGSGLVNFRSPNNSLNMGEWNHVVCSYDGVNGVGKFYQNGVNINVSASTGTVPYAVAGYGGSILYTSVAGSSTYSNFDFGIGQYWLDNSYIDLSVEANRNLFYTKNNEPVDLGANGENVTGSPPIVFFPFVYSNGASDWAVNKGTVTGFSASGGGVTNAGTILAFT